MGRPKLADGKAKGAVIGLRFTPKEKEKIRREADRLGISITQYLKEKLVAS